MADISQYLQDILDAVYGEQVRGSIHDAIDIINKVSEVILTTGTAVSGPTSSSTGFYTDSLYLNTNTDELWKCVGTDSWTSLGVLKGSPGTPGEDGNKWYRGTGISGKAGNPTVYANSGIADANPNDFYLNPSEGAVYHCVTGGDAATATWSYDFTMTGGGGGGSTVTWTQIQGSTGATKIAEIDIDGSTTSVYAPSGGGSSTLGGLSDVDLTTPSNGQVLTYDSANSEWVNANAPTGGHTMISNSGYVSTMKTHALDDTDDDVASVYAISNWSNCSARLVLTTASKDDDGVGTWLDTDWENGTRSGWLWSESLYHVLDDGASPTPTRNYDVEIIPVFDTDDGEVISLYAMRIDDDYPQSIGGVAKNGGCIAFKFNGAVQSANGVKVGVKLVYQRTEVVDTGRIIS